MTDILDAETLSKVSGLEVIDPAGTKVAFGSIFERTKTIVVFIRKFYWAKKLLRITRFSQFLRSFSLWGERSFVLLHHKLG
jgi:hypothetical protein